MYEEQVGWAVEEGAEFVVAETLDWFAEASIALEVIQSHKLPAVVNFLSASERTSARHEYDQACRVLSERGAPAVGLNCGHGPATLRPLLTKVIKAVEGKNNVAALPGNVPHNREGSVFPDVASSQPRSWLPSRAGAVRSYAL